MTTGDEKNMRNEIVKKASNKVISHYWGYENGDFGYWECEEE